MWLLHNDFNDLHYIFVLIRSNPENTALAATLEEMAAYLARPDETTVIQANTVRHIMQQYVQENDELFQWVFAEKAPTELVKDNACYAVISAVLLELVCALRDDAERAYLAADAVHNIPLLLLEAKNPYRAISDCIQEYREKYHNDFLKSELSLLKRKQKFFGLV